MAGWTHAVCEACWQYLHPNRRPVRVKDSGRARCCYCGRSTVSGIFVRDDPGLTPHPKGHTEA